MYTNNPELVILYEHPEWQKPLFAALERRGIRFQPFDLKQAAFSNAEAPAATLTVPVVVNDAPAADWLSRRFPPKMLIAPALVDAPRLDQVND